MCLGKLTRSLGIDGDVKTICFWYWNTCVTSVITLDMIITCPEHGSWDRNSSSQAFLQLPLKSFEPAKRPRLKRLPLGPLQGPIVLTYNTQEATWCHGLLTLLKLLSATDSYTVLSLSTYSVA